MSSTLFLSDIHFGTFRCNAKKLYTLLSNVNPTKIVLVGDILDIWLWEKGKIKWNKWHTKVLEFFINFLGEGKEIIYICGNHDANFRKLIESGFLKFDNFSLRREYFHNTSDGYQYLVTHGDEHSHYSSGTWKQYFYNWGYDTITPLSNLISRITNGKISLIKILKTKAKKYLLKYRENLSDYAVLGWYDGVITGHIHNPEICMDHDGFMYMNCGDWCDHCTGIIETNGEFKLICSEDFVER